MSDWQTIIVAIVVILAAGYVGWKVVQELRGKKTCGGCGCVKKKDASKSSEPTFVPADQLQVRK